MVCGVGVGTALSVNGSIAHAVCHILYKALLFMAVGAVIYRTGRRRLSELGGFATAMPLTFAMYMVGALSISGAPLFNGFVSKSLVVAGAGEAHHGWVVFLLTLASVGTFLSVGLKLPYFAFFGDNDGPRDQIDVDPKDAPASMMAAMAVLAFLCFAIGVAPGFLYQALPAPPSYDPFTVYHFFEMVLVMAILCPGFLAAASQARAARRLHPRFGPSIQAPGELAGGGGVAPHRFSCHRSGESDLFDQGRSGPLVSRSDTVGKK